jgi:hypothetical protein
MTVSDIRDGDWRLLDYDPETGVKRWYLHLDNNMSVIRTETPVDDLLAENAEAYNNSLASNWGDGQRVASIPLNIYFEQLAEARKNGDRNYIKRWLNDSDHAKFRTFKGRV